ncbi:hypothetical protein P4O66_016116 [Electrophorus voltai]|uniref:Claudin n=1 Tax=Electrophorus voltai TaxID=2609070 RepID=A0AAD8YXQ0_9TELE|nr:hypothetical protein P4O66_016116 [Electrophorus voltai]
MNSVFEAIGFLLGFLSWVMVGVAVPNRYWKVSTVNGNVITTSTIYENLWMSCATDSTGVHNCREFPSLLALSGYVQASRALMIASIVLGTFGLIATLVGMHCSKIGGENYVLKGRIAALGGVFFILQGLCTMIAVSWYASNITREFFDPLYPGTKFEIGEGLYIGWCSATLALLGGCCLLCACGMTNMQKTRTVIITLISLFTSCVSPLVPALTTPPPKTQHTYNLLCPKLPVVNTDAMRTCESASYVQASRALMIASIVLGTFGLIATLVGMQCSKIGGENYVLKGRIAALGGVFFILQGLCTMTAVSWYAFNITQDFFDPLYPGTKFEIGEGLYIGWCSATLALIGGCCLLCACGTGNKQEKRPYPYQTPTRGTAYTTSVMSQEQPNHYGRNSYV